MSRTKGTYTLTSNIEPKVGAPLDARTIVKLLADLTASNTFEYPYKGMKVFVEENNKSYTLVGSDPTVSTNWIEDNSGGHTIKNPAGTAMTQRSNLQFVDLTVSDDSTNDATKVENIHVIQSESELDNLPDGLYMLDDDEGTVIDGNEVGYDNTDSGLEARNIQDAIDELAQGGGTVVDKEIALFTEYSAFNDPIDYTYTATVAGKYLVVAVAGDNQDEYGNSVSSTGTLIFQETASPVDRHPFINIYQLDVGDTIAVRLSNYSTGKTRGTMAVIARMFGYDFVSLTKLYEDFVRDSTVSKTSVLSAGDNYLLIGTSCGEGSKSSNITFNGFELSSGISLSYTKIYAVKSLGTQVTQTQSGDIAGAGYIVGYLIE